MRRRLLPLGVFVIAAALLAGAVQLQAARERAFPPNQDVEESLYIRSGVAIRRMAVAHSALAADMYWIRAIQYYGGTKRAIANRPQAPEPPPLLAALDPPEY